MNKKSWQMFQKKQPAVTKQQPASMSEKEKSVLEPSSFKAYIDSMRLEPIGKVKERFETVRSINDMIPYINSGQLDKDQTRLELETGKVINKNQPGKYLVNVNPDLARKMYNPKNVINFYEKDLKAVGKNANLESFNTRLAAITTLTSVKGRLRGYSHYAAVLDEASWYLGAEPREAASDRLYKLSTKLPKDKCAVQIKRMKNLAANINGAFR